MNIQTTIKTLVPNWSSIPYLSPTLILKYVGTLRLVSSLNKFLNIEMNFHENMN
jgi:hypothetical protein